MIDKPLDQKIIIITGAAGFIGFHLANKLLDSGHDVIGYDNVNDYYDTQLKEARLDILNGYEKFSFYRKDLLDEMALSEPSGVYPVSQYVGQIHPVW